jgi:MFS family permease
MTSISVFLIGFSSLAFEVLLTRIFSISQFNHLSFMVISIALFGFAASGTFLSIVSSRQVARPRYLAARKTTAVLMMLYTATTIGSFMALNNLPLDYFRLPVEPIQIFYLFAAFVLLALPFFFAGFIVALAYTQKPEKTGLIYFATMCGSALGAIFPSLLLPFFNEGRLVVISALVPLIGLAPMAGSAGKNQTVPEGRKSNRTLWLSAGLMIFFGAIYPLTPYGDALIRVKASPYKALSQILQFPDTHIDQTFSNIRGRIDRVSSPYIRFAPGLSLRYMQNITQYEAAFRDGDHQLVLYPPHARQPYPFSSFTLSYSGYDLRSNAKSVLVLLQGGGTAIPCVQASKIEDITVVIENPPLADIVSQHYGFPVISQPPRAFLSQSLRHFDIIHVENWGTSIPGSTALDQNYLFTIDAFRQYLAHLTSDGLVIISRRLLLPPTDSLRLWGGAYEGLKMSGARNPANHLAVIRNWDTFTLLVSKQPFWDAARLEKFARNRNFDLVFLPGITAGQANRFNKFDAPYHFNEINRLASAYLRGEENAYFKSYFLDIRPQSDNRPFPGRYLKWRKIESLYRTLGSRFYAMLMSGEIVVLVVFFEALAVSLFLLFLPLLFVRRSAKKPSLPQALYFFAVGSGFMFIELFFIKKYNLLFGDPVISFTIVVAGILIFSSFGGAWAQKKEKTVLKKVLPGLIAMLVLGFFTLDDFMNYLLRFSTIWRYSGAALVLFPVGFLMGLPFPIGMRDMLSTSAQRAYAWSLNGCASILASIVSAQLAIIFGILFLLGCAIAAYLIVIFSWRYM